MQKFCGQIESKNNYFTKIDVTKKTTAQILAALPIYTNSPQKNFSKGKFIEYLDIFRKSAS
jgi:hypothetical protein